MTALTAASPNLAYDLGRQLLDLSDDEAAVFLGALSDAERRAVYRVLADPDFQLTTQLESMSGAEMMRRAGKEPDPWQNELLTTEPDRALVNCSRQAGKSECAAAMGLRQSLHKPRSTTLIVSPSQRQSAETLSKVTALMGGLNLPAAITDAESILSLRLSNRSRILALPGKEATVRAFTADLIILDEAARIANSLFEAVTPMLAVSHGRVIAMSTTNGKRGWWYELWVNGGPRWHRSMVTAYDVPRISAEFLAEEKARMPDSRFRAEYCCEFTDADDSVFTTEEVMAALDDELEPMVFG